ncbi:MAG: patatin-like phospholipase family protein [Candidatus Omnitrophica bacterium]|nr:patatin-like phospholipase family protein [Candidatus Omnitrophota bacterium]
MKPSHSCNALSLCGGGSRGAIEVGLYRALVELRIPIHMIFGTSIGAVNGALIAAGLTPDEIAQHWVSLQDRQLFGLSWRLLLRGLKADSVYTTRRLQHVLEGILPVQRFEDLKIPLTVTATDLQTGEAVYLDHGELLPAIMASMALPPYFPPVEYQGRRLVDGGVVDNLPLGVAIERGATRIFALLCHCAQELTQPTKGLLDIQARAFRIGLELKLRHDLEHYNGRAEFIILEPCFDFPPSILTLSGVQSLIEQGYEFAKAELTRRDFGLTPATSRERGPQPPRA